MFMVINTAPIENRPKFKQEGYCISCQRCDFQRHFPNAFVDRFEMQLALAARDIHTQDNAKHNVVLWTSSRLNGGKSEWFPAIQIDAIKLPEYESSSTLQNAFIASLATPLKAKILAAELTAADWIARAARRSPKDFNSPPPAA